MKTNNDSNYDFRNDELEIIRNMTWDEVEKMETLMYKYEKENIEYLKIQKKFAIMGITSFTLFLISVFSFRFASSAIAVGFFIHCLIKFKKYYNDIFINKCVINSIKEDILYYRSL